MLSLLTFVHAQTLHSSAFRLYTDRTVRFGVPGYSVPPFMTRDATTGAFSGFLPAIIDVIATEIGASYELVPILYPPERRMALRSTLRR